MRTALLHCVQTALALFIQWPLIFALSYRSGSYVLLRSDRPRVTFFCCVLFLYFFMVLFGYPDNEFRELAVTSDLGIIVYAGFALLRIFLVACLYFPRNNVSRDASVEIVRSSLSGMDWENEPTLQATLS